VPLSDPRNDCGDGFHIEREPETNPPPILAARAIDAHVRPELWGWQPGHDYPDAFTRGAVLAFRCYRTVAGDRVFLPEWGGDWEGFVRTAARYGVAVLDQARGRTSRSTTR
jgi:hypothetical protein